MRPTRQLVLGGFVVWALLLGAVHSVIPFPWDKDASYVLFGIPLYTWMVGPAIWIGIMIGTAELSVEILTLILGLGLLVKALSTWLAKKVGWWAKAQRPR